MKKIVENFIMMLAAALTVSSCFNLDEETFDRISADSFYNDESSVKGAVASIYYNAANGFVEYDWYLQELSADQIAWRTWNGGLWGWDEGLKFVLSAHNWTAEAKIIEQAWQKAWTTIGLCNQVINDLGAIDASSIGMTAEGISSCIAEVRTLRAWQYYQIFELWGGALPLNVSSSSDVPGSASEDFDQGCRIIYDFIAKELDESCEHLAKNEVNRMNQAANRVLKARLLLNAGIFIGEEHFSECAAICEDIIGGKYGQYSIAEDYRDIFNFGNESCPEIIFAFASDFSHIIDNMINMRDVIFLPSTGYSQITRYTGVKSGWNCCCLAPSYDNSGEVQTQGGSTGAKCFLDAPYSDKLGAVYERFSNNDMRKRNYEWTTDGWNGGIMLTGAQFILADPKDGESKGDPVKADADRQDQPLVYVDQVGTFQNIGRNLEDVMSPRWGETNSGYRLMKYPMAPAEDSRRWEDIDEVEIRLSEVVFMLAECKVRGNGADEAKNLVNTVRKRYFADADWTAEKDNTGRCSSAIDKDWMLDQWGQEFLCEGRRRRTDLRRFDKFTQGQWWFFGRATEDGYNLPAQRERKYEWFPLPASALSVNPGLVQNPNYK